MGDDETEGNDGTREDPKAEDTDEESPPHFSLLEYKELKKEVAQRTQESNTLMRYSMVGVAGLYAWLAKPPEQIDSTIYQAAWWIPVFIPILGGLRSFGVLMRILLIGRYIKLIEEYFVLRLKGSRTTNVPAAHVPQGWEHYLLASRHGFLVASAISTWLLMLIGTILIAVRVASQPACNLTGLFCG